MLPSVVFLAAALFVGTGAVPTFLGSTTPEAQVDSPIDSGATSNGCFKCKQGTCVENQCVCDDCYEGERCDVLKKCERPTEPFANGKIRYKNKNKCGKPVIYRCYKKFELVGNKERICQPNGTWSGIAPTCRGQDHCPALPNIIGGSWDSSGCTGSHSSPEAVCRGSCDGGRVPESGSAVFTCGSDGSWDQTDVLTCALITCLPLADIPNGSWQQDTCGGGRRTPSLVSCTSTCDFGYQPAMGPSAVTCDADGNWNPPLMRPACGFIPCNALPGIDDGSWDSLSCTVGSALPETMCTATCNSGYQASGGESQFTCNLGGSWDYTNSEKLICVIEQASTTHFPENGEYTLARGDDTGEYISLSKSFRYYSQDYTSIWITTNGGIVFGGSKTSTYLPTPPFAGDKTMAIFWNDIKTTDEGNIYYRETRDSSVLSSIEADLRNAVNVNLTWAFTVTFDNVPSFGSDYPGNNDFQAILAQTAGGAESFVIFKYTRIEWKISDLQIGFNAGDGVNFYSQPDTDTATAWELPRTLRFQVDGTPVVPLD